MCVLVNIIFYCAFEFQWQGGHSKGRSEGINVIFPHRHRYQLWLDRLLYRRTASFLER